MSNGQATIPQRTTISIVKQVLFNPDGVHERDRPKAAFLLRSFTSHARSLAPAQSYQILETEMRRRGKLLEACILDPAHHPEIAAMMTQLGLDANVIPLWASSEASHRTTAPSPPRTPVCSPPEQRTEPPTSGMDGQDLWRQSTAAELTSKIQALVPSFAAIYTAHTKLQADHQTLKMDHSHCLAASQSASSTLCAARDAHDKLTRERDEVKLSAAAAEEVLSELEDSSLNTIRQLSSELDVAAAAASVGQSRIAALEAELSAEKRAREEAGETIKRLEEEIRKIQQSPPAVSSSRPSLSPSPSTSDLPSDPNPLKRSASPGMPPPGLPPPSKRASPSPRPSISSTSRPPRSVLGLSGRPVFLPSLSTVDLRFGAGWPSREEQRDLWTAFWASQTFPTDLDPDAKVCLLCAVERSDRGESAPGPVKFEKSTLKVRREAQMSHVEERHEKVWREIRKGKRERGEGN